MKILGIHSGHDANYCIFEDGKITLHNELERFTRKKHDSNEDDLLSLITSNGHNTWESYDKLVLALMYRGTEISPSFVESQENQIIVGHHMCHASAAYYDSGFNDALVFTIDGGGYEPTSFWTSATVSVCEKNKINMVYKNHLFDLGNYWSQLLEVFGLGNVWTPEGDQSGTLMAMSAYGDPYKYLEEFNDINESVSRNLPSEKLKRFKKIHDSDEQAKFDLAASLQYKTEDFIKSFIFSHLNHSISDDKSIKNICFSGGTMLNCVALGKISKILKGMGYNVFCDQAPNDSGLSIGAVKYYYYHLLDNPLPSDTNTPKNSYLGKTYSSEEIIESINGYSNISIQKDVTLDKVVELLMGSKIIALFNGGSESGKRALGNRSIIADPRFGFIDRKSTRLNSSHVSESRMPSSA